MKVHDSRATQSMRVTRSVRIRDHPLHKGLCAELRSARLPSSRCEGTGHGAAVGLRLPGRPSPSRIGSLVPSYRAVQGCRADSTSPRSGNPPAPGGASQIRARRPCPAGRPQSAASPFVLGHLRRDRRYLTGLAPPVGGQTLDVSPSPTGVVRPSTTRRPPSLCAWPPRTRGGAIGVSKVNF